MVQKILQTPRVLIFCHNIIMQFTYYTLSLCFVLLILKIVIKYYGKYKQTDQSLFKKWIFFGILLLLKYLISQFIISTLILMILSIILILLLFPLSFNSNYVEKDKVMKQNNLNKQTVFFVQLSRFLLKTLNKVINLIPTEIREIELKQQITIINKLFSKPQNNPHLNQIQIQISNHEQQNPPTFTSLCIISLMNERNKVIEQIDEDNFIRKKTINSQISRIYNPRTQVQTLFSPNQQAEIFRFEEATKFPQWKQIMQIQQCHLYKISGLNQKQALAKFECDQIIQLTKKSYVFFRLIVIIKSIQGIEIMVKNNRIENKKFLTNFDMQLIDEQIVQLKINENHHFYRFQTKQKTQSFIKQISNN